MDDIERARRLGAFGTVVDTEHRIEPSLVGCAHTDLLLPVVPSAPGCEQCLAMGSNWVHLRLCMTCGEVGCCDSSPQRHASRHHYATDHPIVASAEPGEEWAWCFPDERVLVRLDERPGAPA